jgi:predicted Zn-dependent peptidase
MRARIPNEKIEWTELNSGLKVVTVEMPAFYTISAGFLVKAGSRYELPHEIGLSHFIEHMLFKGSKKYSAMQISQKIEGRGGQLNAYTCEESTCFYLKTQPESFFESMDVLLDLYTSPQFDLLELEKEREVIIEELHAYEDQPSLYIDDLFASVIWSGHPLGNLILGAEEQIAKYTKNDVENYFQRYYTAPNTVLAVAGCITHQEVLDWVSKNEIQIPPGVPNTFLPFQHKQHSPRLHLMMKDSEQCNMQVGVPCSNRHSSKEWALRLLSTIAGENMSSRLFQEIREKRGLVYHVSSGLELYEDVGCFYFQCGVDPEKVEVCLTESLAVLKSLCQKPVEPDELDRAKTFVIGQALQDMESTLSCMLWVGDKLLSRDGDFSTVLFCANIEAVTSLEIQNAAQEIFKTACLNMALIGPYEKSVDLSKCLTFENLGSIKS